MPIAFVPFKPLDLLGGMYDNGGSSIVCGLAPIAGKYGYSRFLGIKEEGHSATALDTAARGGTTIRKSGTNYVYVGTTGRIYLETLGTLTNVSKGGVGATPYSTSSTDWGWSFTQWGDGIIATNYVDAVQYKSDYTTTAAFADAFTSTLKPKGKFITVVKNQVFLAYTNEGGTAYPNRVRWGAVDNVLGMDSSPSTQSDYQDLLDNYGNITGMVGGEYALIFKERAIYKCTYVGAPLIYRFDLLAAGIGTIHPGSIVEFEGSVYFWGNNKAYVIGPGAETIDPIEDGAIPAILLQHTYSANNGWPGSPNFDLSVTNSYLVHSAVDLSNGLIVWAFPSRSSVGEANLIVYSPQANSASLCSGRGRTTALQPIKLQWLIQGANADPSTVSVGTAPGGNGTCLIGIQLTGKLICDMASVPYTTPYIGSGFLTAGLGKRAVITAVRPIFYPGDNYNEGSPVSAVDVIKVTYAGAMTGSASTFTAATSSNGWWYGKANGEWLVIRTYFDVYAPHKCIGWEVVFDEIGSER